MAQRRILSIDAKRGSGMKRLYVGFTLAAAGAGAGIYVWNNNEEPASQVVLVARETSNTMGGADIANPFSRGPANNSYGDQEAGTGNAWTRALEEATARADKVDEEDSKRAIEREQLILKIQQEFDQFRMTSPTLYAQYWFLRERLRERDPLSFLDVSKDWDRPATKDFINQFHQIAYNLLDELPILIRRGTLNDSENDLRSFIYKVWDDCFNQAVGPERERFDECVRRRNYALTQIPSSPMPQ